MYAENRSSARVVEWLGFWTKFMIIALIKKSSAIIYLLFVENDFVFAVFHCSVLLFRFLLLATKDCTNRILIFTTDHETRKFDIYA